MIETGGHLILLHGRKTDNEEMDDWGFNGPLLVEIAWLHWTYSNSIDLCFISEKATMKAQIETGWEQFDDCVLSMRLKEGLVVTDEPIDGRCYYGDFELQMPGYRLALEENTSSSL